MVFLGKRWISFSILGRLLLTGVLMAGLAAIMLLPVLLHFDRIGKHPSEFEAGWVVPLQDVIPLYFDPAVTRFINVFFPSTQEHWYRPVQSSAEFYYSFVTPGWFFLLLLLIPFYHPAARWERRLWLVAILLVVLATLWGAGGNSVFIWLYKTVPFLGQWRFVGRALAVAAFWLAVLVAVRADSLWNIAFLTNWHKLGVIRPIARWLPALLGAGLLLSSGLAAIQVNNQWDKLEATIKPINTQADKCISWLRQTYPDRPLSVWQFDYRHMTTFLSNRVRSWDIQSDFEMRALPSTIGQPDFDLNTFYPEFAFIDQRHDHQTLLGSGYLPLTGSPYFNRPYHCLYRNTNFIPYAYTVALSDLLVQRTPDSPNRLEMPSYLFTPVTVLQHQPDAITVRVEGERRRKMVLGVQERAYPGWQVTINGQPAQLESVGGQIGVSLPLGDEPIVAHFEYRPPLVMLGGAITIATSALCAIYLLRGRRKQSATSK